jgi:hypothetical protein
MSLRICFLCLCLFSEAIDAGSKPARAEKPPIDEPSTAFYYTGELPADALSHFDRVVVQADQADAAGLALQSRRRSMEYA